MCIGVKDTPTGEPLLDSTVYPWSSLPRRAINPSSKQLAEEVIRRAKLLAVQRIPRPQHWSVDTLKQWLTDHPPRDAATLSFLRKTTAGVRAQLKAGIEDYGVLAAAAANRRNLPQVLAVGEAGVRAPPRAGLDGAPAAAAAATTNGQNLPQVLTVGEERVGAQPKAGVEDEGAPAAPATNNCQNLPQVLAVGDPNTGDAASAYSAASSSTKSQELVDPADDNSPLLLSEAVREMAAGIRYAAELEDKQAREFNLTERQQHVITIKLQQIKDGNNIVDKCEDKLLGLEQGHPLFSTIHKRMLANLEEIALLEKDVKRLQSSIEAHLVGGGKRSSNMQRGGKRKASEVSQCAT